VVKTVYGYARVSSTDQNLDRQLEQIKPYVTDTRYIITDKASGKDFNRKGYNSLVGTPDTAPRLQEGDLLGIDSLDRLGRNYIEIREQWQYITNVLKADIKVIDMPLLDTSTSTDTLDKRFIADLVLQILSYTAEKERESIRIRQAQGIAVAKAQGKHLGRPKIEYPDQWLQIYKQWKARDITAVKAMDLLGIKRTSFYKLVKQYEE
jgi:DNA invertase Pin-like site-specific DNA recombinase